LLQKRQKERAAWGLGIGAGMGWCGVSRRQPAGCVFQICVGLITGALRAFRSSTTPLLNAWPPCCPPTHDSKPPTHRHDRPRHAHPRALRRLGLHLPRHRAAGGGRLGRDLRQHAGAAGQAPGAAQGAGSVNCDGPSLEGWR